MRMVYIKAFIPIIFFIYSLSTFAQMESLSGQWVSDLPIRLENHEIKAFILNDLDETIMDKEWKWEGVMCDQFDDQDRWVRPSAFNYYIDGNHMGFRISFSAAGITEGSQLVFDYEFKDQDTLILQSGNQIGIYKRKDTKREARI